jgi:hypothetical protein
MRRDLIMTDEATMKEIDWVVGSPAAAGLPVVEF